MIVLQSGREKVRAVQFSPDGMALVAPCSSGANLWSHPFGGPPAYQENHRQGVNAACFAPDGRHLVLCGSSLVIVDLSSREETTVPLELGARSMTFALSPDGRAVVVTQWWPPAPRHPWLSSPQQGVARLSCRPTAAADAPLWSADGVGRAICPPLFLPDGSQFVLLELRQGAKFVMRNSGTGAVLAEAEAGAGALFGGSVMSPDGRVIACYRADQVALYRVEDLAAVPVTFANDNPKQFTGLAFHPSGRYLAATSNDGTVKLYDASTRRMVRAFNWGVGRLRSVAFSPDGMLAAAGGDEGKIVLWDVDL